MSTERIDVLHVVGAGCDDCRTKGGLAYITIDGIAFDAQKVAKSVLRDAAVAEMIEATIEFRACLAALVICQEQEAPEDIYEAISERYLKADTRCAAALARVGGAA